jgi:hypothetical protein
MLKNIFIFTVGAIVAIPILLWFAIRGIFTGSWQLLAFVCKRQYEELKRLCERGTAAELQAFLAAHPGAAEYIVYARQDKKTSFLTTLFRLPAPLAVASQANNLPVIPVLLANGADPEVRSVSASQSPAEAAIGEPDKMRALCGGKTWWMERTRNQDVFQTVEPRAIVWKVMRGARLTAPEQLFSVRFLRQSRVMKEFICRFGIEEGKRREFFATLKQIPPQKRAQLKYHRLCTPLGCNGVVSLPDEFDVMMQALEKSLHPLPEVNDDAMRRLMFSAGLLDRPKMLDLLNTLFSMEQQFALLDNFTRVPPSHDDRELKEDVVDLLLCSILQQAGDRPR